MSGPTPRRLRQFAVEKLALETFIREPGDGRVFPQIPAADLLWALVAGHVLRDHSHRGVEALVEPCPSSIGVGRSFGDDTLAYFTERLSPERLRQALNGLLRRAKRNKAFAGGRLIGLALDGSQGGGSSEKRCPWCVPCVNDKNEVTGYRHHFSMISVVGTGLSLPFDVEPYGPGGCESTASTCLLQRAIGHLGVRFADYVVADGLYATAPWLHAVGALGPRAVVRLKGNLPTLLAAAQTRFQGTPPMATFVDGEDRVEVWDAANFDPWDALRWTTVRVLRYRQHHPDGTVVEAYWLTDFSPAECTTRELYGIAKSRWEIENQGFNDAKNRYGMKHTRHHHENSVVVGWLIALLAIVIERLYRLRHLRRGGRPVLSAIDLVRILRRALGEADAEHRLRHELRRQYRQTIPSSAPGG
jgi:hypothetical protein